VDRVVCIRPTKGYRCCINASTPANGNYVERPVDVQRTISKLGCFEYPSAEAMESLKSMARKDSICPGVIPRNKPIGKLSIEIDTLGANPVPNCTLIVDNVSSLMANSLAMLLAHFAYASPIFVGPMTRVKANLWEVVFENISFESCCYLKKIICELSYRAPRNTNSVKPLTPHQAAVESNKQALARLRAQQKAELEAIKQNMLAQRQAAKSISSSAAAAASRPVFVNNKTHIPEVNLDDEVREFLNFEDENVPSDDISPEDAAALLDIADQYY